MNNPKKESQRIFNLLKNPQNLATENLQINVKCSENEMKFVWKTSKSSKLEWNEMKISVLVFSIIWISEEFWKNAQNWPKILKIDPKNPHKSSKYPSKIQKIDPKSSNFQWINKWQFIGCFNSYFWVITRWWSGAPLRPPAPYPSHRSAPMRAALLQLIWAAEFHFRRSISGLHVARDIGLPSSAAINLNSPNQRRETDFYSQLEQHLALISTCNGGKFEFQDLILATTRFTAECDWHA